LRQSSDGCKDIVDPHAVVEGAGIRCLNNGAVGDGIAIGKADLDQAGAAFHQLGDQQFGGLQIRIAGSQEGNKSHLALTAKTLK
jgi:hypothetical protein